MARQTKSEALASGQLIRVYGKNTLIGVSPVPEIDRVRFSIVQLNSSGKDFLDLYLTTEEFRQFCEEIDNGVAKQKIDKPSTDGKPVVAYSFVKGENGAKKLTISKGNVGIMVNISDGSGGKDNFKKKLAIVQYADLKELSFMFKLTYGLIPIIDGSYYAKLYKSFNDNIGKFNNKYDAASEDYVPAPVAEPVAEVKEEPKTEAPAVRPLGTETWNYTVVFKGKPQFSNGRYGFPVLVKELDKSTYLTFPEDVAKGLVWFNKLIERISNTETETSMRVKVCKEGDYFRFLEANPTK